MCACVLCNHRSVSPLYAGISKCHRCGHVYANVALRHEDAMRLYSRNYFVDGEYVDYLADKEVLQKNFRLRLAVLQKWLEPTRHKHLFEIGCAYGFFLDLVRNDYESAGGIDLAADAVAYAREQLHLNAIAGDFLTYELDGTDFDIVCLWDTIEHLRDPHLYLQKISRHMKSGGLLALTTGDIGSVNARIQGRRWRLLHPPTHLHYFSRASLTRLLDACGFDTVYNRYCGFYRSFHNVAYSVLVLHGRSSRLYNLLRRTALLGGAFYLNLYDIMYVIARKR